MRRTRAALLLAALIVGADQGDAWAQAEPGGAEAGPGAAELFRLGKEAYEREDFARAAELFTRCYRRSGDPSLLFNIAQAERRAGDCGRAAQHYRQFLAEVPEAENRADAEAKLADMERCAARRPVAAAPPPSPPAATAAVTGAPVDRADSRARPIGLWVAGGGALVLGASAFFLVRAWNADRELDELFAEGGVYDEHHQALADRLDSSRTLAIVTGAVGTAAVAGGLIVHLALRRRRAEPPRAGLAVSPGGAMLVVGCDL